MKNKSIAKILGVALTAGLVLAVISAVFVSPAAADETEWSTVDTPSWEDNFIEPGSDIWDYAVGPDGDTIIALGVVNSADVIGEGVTGISGSFNISSAQVTLTKISADPTNGVAEFSGTLYGDACYLRGDFTAIFRSVDITGFVDDCVAAVAGEISGDPEAGDTDDELTFSGKLYGMVLDWAGDDTLTMDLTPVSDVLCVNNGWFMDGLDIGVVSTAGTPGPGAGGIGIYRQPRVWISDDGGVTWDDITGTVQDSSNMPGPFITFGPFGGTAIASDDEDWAVIAGTMFHPDYINIPGASKPFFGPFSSPGIPACVATNDGADNFSYTGDLEDTSVGTMFYRIYDVDASIEVGDIHNIAIAGLIIDASISYPLPSTPVYQNGPQRIPVWGSIYRLEAGTWLSASWEDTTSYAGWDSGVPCSGPCQPWAPGWPTPPVGLCDLSVAVIACQFSPNFDVDDTIVCMTHDLCGVPYLQSGTWASGGDWNDEAAFPEAVEITSDGETILTGAGTRAMGLALPDSYDGTSPSDRVIFCYVNSYNVVSGVVGGYVFRIDDSAISPVCGPSGDPLLASMDVHGDADTGKIMIGEYMQWDNDAGDPGDPLRFDCCEGVRVWHTEELDFCCPQWDDCCKCPSGPYMAMVTYTPDGDKAYAATRGAVDEVAPVTPRMKKVDFFGGLCDESAFSVSRDDAVSFNQIGLIDTDIDVLSDVAVCPNCDTLYLSTINEMDSFYCCPLEPDLGMCLSLSCGMGCGMGCGLGCDSECITECGGAEPPCYPECFNECYDPCMCDCYPPCVENCYEMHSQKEICEVCECDSVWRSYDDGDTWERVFHGDWSDGDEGKALLLRLPCDAIEDCCDQDEVAPSGTIYLGLQGTDEIYYSRDCGQCWNNPPDTKITIQDMAVESENIVYVLDADGYVSKSTQYGRRWSDKVDTDIGSGHSIVACCEEGLVVVGGMEGGKVAWSDDSADSFELTDELPSGAEEHVHVACDPVCENIIYAAADIGGIYRTDITDGSWDDLEPVYEDYTGIVVAREGTLYAAFDDHNVDPTKDLCEEGRFGDGPERYSGVARNLTPCETDCCGTEDWDYLICGLHDQEGCENEGEDFDNQPTSLRICGCLSAATNSVLYAIDTQPYDVQNGSSSNTPYGGLWSYEDCAAKIGPTLTSPADGTVVDCEPCLGCDAANFTMKWERICNACSYDIEIMDEDGNLIINWDDITITGDPPELYVDGTIDSTVYELACGGTYTWHVRQADTDCECIHSQWSETWSFTVAVGAVDAIKLLAPDEGELGVPIENIGFSWTSVTDATSYSFVLAPTAALTGALASQDLSTTAFNYSGPLDYGKAYYWQVKAWKDDVLLTTSSIGVFNTGMEPEDAPPPVVVETTPAPIIEIPPTQQITPTWIYAIIGIGAALAVVVIVLIVRTRRPRS